MRYVSDGEKKKEKNRMLKYIFGQLCILESVCLHFRVYVSKC